MDYADWNDLIAERFFNKEMKGKEVLLYINEDIINEIGSKFGKNVQNFVECVKIGPSGATSTKICHNALQIYKEWRVNRQGYPQYLAYLALFVLAATKDGDFDPKAYYPRLRTLVNEPSKTGTYPSFDKMVKLWEDLEKWTKNNKHEELGRFTKRIRGGMVHIGIPLSQTLLSEDERKNLPRIFFESGIDRLDNLLEEEMRKILLDHGQKYLAKRTISLLKDEREEIVDIRNGLIEFVIDELSDWDEATSESISEAEFADNLPQILRAKFRLYIEIDHVAQNVLISMRFKTGYRFPDSGLNFTYSEKVYSCTEAAPTWSSKLKGLNALNFDLLKTHIFEDKENKWQASFKGSPIHLLAKEDIFGLQGWIETWHLEYNTKFLILCRFDKKEDVLRWGNQSCYKFTQLKLNGLPSDWQLFEGEGASESCANVSVLTLPTSLHLKLEDGIKIDNGNTYLRFAPPSILLKGGRGNERVLANGLDLKKESSAARWYLPHNLPANSYLDIEVYSNDETLLIRRTIKLVMSEMPRSFNNIIKRNNIGDIIKLEDDLEGPYVAGCVISGAFSTPPCILLTGLPQYNFTKMIFLGSRPGEISEYRKGGVLPNEWQPVWALIKIGRDRWSVHFCGLPEHNQITHKPGKPLKNRHAAKRWKEAIWINRKKIIEPQIHLLKGIWSSYKEAASRV